MSFNSIIILIFMLNLCQSPLHANYASGSEIYIVHVEAPEARPASQSDDLESWYRSFLPTTTTATEGDERIMYSYSSVFKGFAARLSPQEVRVMAEKDGFISARPEQKLSLHTTHTPNFLGLNRNTGFWRDSNYGKGVIIGVIDTGVFPDHPSFSDEGMPPPPAKWKGKCEFRRGTCNNKIIGARFFKRGSGQSPVDDNGHGTHTASTAAGNFVEGANILGSANGTASGIAPLAHLAIYKVCSPSCSESDVLAAMDAGINDGVDIMSMSLGGSPNYFHSDAIALGAFSAIQKGILVSCSAGNNGPFVSSVSNGAPWILTVGASTTDRSIIATAVLGNNQTFDGQSAFQPRDFPRTQVPLVYARMLDAGDIDLPYCTPESLSRANIRGKIVMCESGLIAGVEKGRAVRKGGGVGMILLNPQLYANTTFSEPHVVPATHVSYGDGLKIIEYVTTTSTPTATFLFRGTIIGDDRAPVVAAFSSRGPNLVSPGIMKPDILGPGVNILAAWPVSVGNNTNTTNANSNTNTNANTTSRKATYNIISGTSMSCPHLSGVAALLKSTHPDWSPAAIKSAIMTTADVVNLAGDPILDEAYLPAGIFATGSGHVNPSRANNPGIVYDIQPEDYIPYLCGLGYSSRQVTMIVQRRVSCRAQTSIPEAQLNYPSFTLNFGSGQPASQTYSRTVTNVGEPKSSYVVEIGQPPGIDVVVEPTKLEFSKLNQKLQYMVMFKRSATASSDNSDGQGFLKWKSLAFNSFIPISMIDIAE